MLGDLIQIFSRIIRDFNYIFLHSLISLHMEGEMREWRKLNEAFKIG